VNILVLLKMVPDVVEELEVAADGRSLEREFLRLVVNERDEHALEEALLLKERHAAAVTVVAPEASEIDDVLFTALAKGADRAVKITGLDASLSTHAAAPCLARALAQLGDAMPADLVLTGCQASDDLDGQTAAALACELGLPYLGIVSRVVVDPATNTATVLKEFAGGMRGEFVIALPAVLGIQAAEKPPRYVPVAKVRAAAKARVVESVVASAPRDPLVRVMRMTKPETTTRAHMLDGTPEEVAGKLCAILAERGVL
jgi:electron transfer flavoprotein beta subunit